MYIKKRKAKNLVYTTAKIIRLLFEFIIIQKHNKIYWINKKIKIDWNQLLKIKQFFTLETTCKAISFYYSYFPSLYRQFSYIQFLFSRLIQTRNFFFFNIYSSCMRDIIIYGDWGMNVCQVSIIFSLFCFLENWFFIYFLSKIKYE